MELLLGVPSLAPVALLVVVCQQLPAVHYTARWKVGHSVRWAVVIDFGAPVHVLAEASGATLLLAGLASCCSLVVGGAHCVQCAFAGEKGLQSTHTLHHGCWRPNGFIRPVLKHGPRSLTCAQVLG